MKKTIHRKFLLLLTFVSGACVMIVELTASRLLAPYFGSSLFVWTNLIGLILIFLSLGYYLGGKLADKYSRSSLLLQIIFIAGIIIFLIPFLIKPIASLITLDLFVKNSTSFTILFGSFFATLILFVFPITLLGMVCPYVIKLLTHDRENVGKQSGLVFAFSTAGSILGTFLSTLVCVPLFGTRNTIFLAAALLVLFSSVGVFRQGWLAYIILPSILTGGWIWTHCTQIKDGEDIVLEDESAYHYIQIKKEDKDYYLRLENGMSISSVYHPYQEFSGFYFDYLNLLPYIESEEKDKKVAILGLAGGTTVHQYNRLLSNEFNFQIDGVELDDKLIDIARTYFDLNYTNLNIYNTDARIFLSRNKDRYDIVIIDVFSNQLYIPPHLTTSEFFQEVKNHLEDNGVLAMNIGATSEDTTLLLAITNSVAKNFAYVYLAPIKNSYNFLAIASQKQIDFRALPGKIKNNHLQNLAYTINAQVKRIYYDPKKIILTDDRAPVEFLTDSMVFSYLR